MSNQKSFVSPIPASVTGISASYTAALTDYIVDITTSGAGSITVQLQPASSYYSSYLFIVKDISGSAQYNNIIVSSSGSDLIDTSTSATINTNYGFCEFYSDGTNNWYTSSNSFYPSGTGVLSSGTFIVNTPFVRTKSLIFVTFVDTGALTNVGSPVIGTIVDKTSFVVKSTNALDASAFNWFILN